MPDRYGRSGGPFLDQVEAEQRETRSAAIEGRDPDYSVANLFPTDDHIVSLEVDVTDDEAVQNALDTIKEAVDRVNTATTDSVEPQPNVIIIVSQNTAENNDLADKPGDNTPTSPGTDVPVSPDASSNDTSSEPATEAPAITPDATNTGDVFEGTTSEETPVDTGAPSTDQVAPAEAPQEVTSTPETGSEGQVAPSVPLETDPVTNSNAEPTNPEAPVAPELPEAPTVTEGQSNGIPEA